MRSSLVAVLLAVASVARAEVSDAVLRVVKDKDVRIVLKNGTEVVAHVNDFDPTTIVFMASDGAVKAIDRATVDEIKVATLSASSSGTPPDLTPLCSLYSSGNPIQVVQTGETYASSDAIEVVTKIAGVIGMQSVPDPVEGNVPNAMATFLGQRRVIVYNSAFMDKVAGASGTKWAYYAILAHELGHHLNFHLSSRSTADSWHQELQADYFSGTALAKLGATLSEAQSAMRTLGTMYGTAGSSTHPPIDQRLAEIEKGYKAGKGAGPSASTNATDGTLPTQTPPQPPAPPPPAAPGVVSVGFMLNGNVALRVQFFVDGNLIGDLTNVPNLGSSSGVAQLTPGNHQVSVRGVAQACNPMGCGTPFPVSGGPAPMQAVAGAIYLVTGAATPQGFGFALNRSQ